MTIFISEYHFGKLAAKNKIAELSYEEVESPTEGKIVLVPDFEKFEVKLIVADTSTKYSTTIPILEKVEGREYYGRSATQIEGKVSILKKFRARVGSIYLWKRWSEHNAYSKY